LAPFSHRQNETMDTLDGISRVMLVVGAAFGRVVTWQIPNVIFALAAIT
jgi:hypothetical protein